MEEICGGYEALEKLHSVTGEPMAPRYQCLGKFVLNFSDWFLLYVSALLTLSCLFQGKVMAISWSKLQTEAQVPVPGSPHSISPAELDKWALTIVTATVGSVSLLNPKGAVESERWRRAECQTWALFHTNCTGQWSWKFWGRWTYLGLLFHG